MWAAEVVCWWAGWLVGGLVGWFSWLPDLFGHEMVGWYAELPGLLMRGANEEGNRK